MPRSSSYDVVVVGAGVIGLACAWRAAQRGLSVLVVERDRPGSGASGVAAGMLAPVTEAEFGEQALLRLNLEGARLWPGFRAELEAASGMATGFAASGALVVATDRDDVEELRRLHRFQVSLELPAEWLSGRECRRLEPGLSPRVAGGVLASEDGHVDPAAVVRALTLALERAGGELLTEMGDAQLLVEHGRIAGVRAPGLGPVHAEHVVAAPGSWAAAVEGLPPGASPPVRPVKGQLLELRAGRGASRPAARVLRTPRCYLVTRADGRAVLGATQEERGFDTTVTADGVQRLLEAGRELLPDLGELELVRAVAGLRPGTPDNAPLIGPAEIEGLVWATGHHRNGVLLAPLTGAAVADLLAGDGLPPAVSPFSPARFASKPQLAGRPA